MLSLSPAVKLWYCPDAVDMRLGFDGLFNLVTNRLRADPLGGHLFIFRNRAADRLKVLYWDQDGLAIWYKRLERGTFQLPSDLLPADARALGAEISAGELSLLLGGIELASVRRRKRYQRPAKPP